MKIGDFHKCNGVMVYWCNGRAASELAAGGLL